jgi:hypothetical protein
MKPKHQPCPCGCGDMADECMNPRNPNPLGAFTLDTYAIPCGVTPNVREVHFLDEHGNTHTITISGKSNHP